MSTTVDSPIPPAKAASKPWRDYPWYAPRFWHGMRVVPWFKLLARNRFAVHPSRWMMAGTVTAYSVGNSAWSIPQALLHGRAIERTKIERDPVFIIGHWRSGTTLLHELMMRDEKFTAPTNFQCFEPHNFLLTQPIVTRFFNWLMPKKRPMDNMDLGWGAPQEDEFALCSMGVPSPYYTIAFPNSPPQFPEYYNMRGLSREEITQWQDAVEWFVKLLTYHTGRQLLLKSPPHTGRVKVLRERFPGAKFIHISRHPYSLYPSTVRLWKALSFAQSFQPNEDADRKEYIFGCFDRMYGHFDEDTAELGEADIHYLRYEDLTADPLGELSNAYDQLGLENFESIQPAIAEYVESKRDYQVNKHNVDPEIQAELAERWKWYFERFGYDA